MMAAGIGARDRPHLPRARRGALGGGAASSLIRGFLALIVGVVFGQTTASLPALHRRGRARGAGLPARRAPAPGGRGRLAGVAIGTIGLAAEWGWSHVWMPIPWPSSLLARGRRGRADRRRGRRRRGRLHRRRARAAAAVPAAARRAAAPRSRRRWCSWGWWAGGCRSSSDGPRSASVALRDCRATRRPLRGGNHPPEPARGGQGPGVPQRDGVAGRRQRARPARARRARASTGPRSRFPSTTAGRRWFACSRATRSCRCRSTCRVTAPFRRPRCPRCSSFTREFKADHQYLQRERKEGVPGGLTALRVPDRAAIALSLMALIAWVLIGSSPVGEPRGPGPLDEAARDARTRADRHEENVPARRIDLLPCPDAESARCVERGNQGGESHWGESPPRGEAQALSALARQLTPQAFERGCASSPRTRSRCSPFSVGALLP